MSWGVAGREGWFRSGGLLLPGSCGSWLELLVPLMATVRWRTDVHLVRWPLWPGRRWAWRLAVWRRVFERRWFWAERPTVAAAVTGDASAP